MSTREEMKRSIAKSDARNLREAARIIRRRHIIFPGVSMALVERVLTAEANNLDFLAAPEETEK